MKKKIVFWGDSITDSLRERTLENENRGHVRALGSGYVRLIEASLSLDYPVQYEIWNRGISGDRIVDLFARIKRDVINLQPDIVSIFIGINDVGHEYAHQNGVDAEKFARVYDRIIVELKEALPGVKIMLMEPFVLPGSSTVTTEQRPGRWEFFSRETCLRQNVVRDIAWKHDLVFVPLQEAFSTAAGKCKTEDYWVGDGIHPNAGGHELIKRKWLESFMQHIHAQD